MPKLNYSHKNGVSDIIINAKDDFWANVDKSKTLVITDENVIELHGDVLDGRNVICLAPGEELKSFQVLGEVLESMVSLGVSKDWHIIGFGGGTVCDLSGLLAAIYMRGLKHSFVPTTLIAQADAAIGGKTAINFASVKNLIGLVNQPQTIYVNTLYLNTLSDTDFFSGLCECIKIGLLADRELFETIEAACLVGKPRDLDLKYIVSRAIAYKCEIVEKDEGSLNIRHLLNFGHTFGHAIESQYKISHGAAVLAGILISLKISQLTGDLADDSLIDRIELIMKALGVDNYLTALKNKELYDLVKFDKKTESGKLKFVIIEKIGSPKIIELKHKKIKEYGQRISE